MDTTNHFYKKFIDQALETGWELLPLPYVEKPTERSLKLKLDVPETGGWFLVMLIDRDETNFLYNPKTDDESKKTRLYHSEHIWWVQSSGKEGVSNREQSLDVTVQDGLSLELLKRRANTCPVCRKQVGVQNLNRVAYANAACGECLKSEAKRLETPGWTN